MGLVGGAGTAGCFFLFKGDRSAFATNRTVDGPGSFELSSRESARGFLAGGSPPGPVGLALLALRAVAPLVLPLAGADGAAPSPPVEVCQFLVH